MRSPSTVCHSACVVLLSSGRRRLSIAAGVSLVSSTFAVRPVVSFGSPTFIVRVHYRVTPTITPLQITPIQLRHFESRHFKSVVLSTIQKRSAVRRARGTPRKRFGGESQKLGDENSITLREGMVEFLESD